MQCKIIYTWVLLLFLYINNNYSSETTPPSTELDIPKQLSFHQLSGLQEYLPKETSVQQLKRDLHYFHENLVQIRGFVYQDADHRWILSSEPNLKSCCAGSSEKIGQQIVLNEKPEGFDHTHAVVLKGNFYVDPQWDSNGLLKQLYRLENLSIEKQNPWFTSSFFLSLIGISSFIFLLILLRKQLFRDFPPNE